MPPFHQAMWDYTDAHAKPTYDLDMFYVDVRILPLKVWTTDADIVMWETVICHHQSDIHYNRVLALRAAQSS